MKIGLPLKLGVLVISVFAIVVLGCIFRTPLRIRFYLSQVWSDEPETRVKGVDALIALGERGEKALAEKLYGGPDAARLLVKSWKDPGQLDTTLLFATFKGYRDLVELLTAKGADPRSIKEYLDAFTVLKLMKMPDVKGRKFIVIDLGPKPENVTYFRGYSRYVIGWLLDEGKVRCKLLENTLEVENIYISGRKIRELDWKKSCDSFLERKYSGLGRSRLSIPTQSTAFAYWAFQRGEEKTASMLLKNARKHLDEYTEPPTLDRHIAKNIMVGKRCGAISSAHGGNSREKLLEQWREIASFFIGDSPCEAHQMVSCYEQMIEEDKNWKKPSGEDLEKMKPAEKVEHWMYHLRDVDAEQCMQPGECRVLGSFPRIDRESKNAAQQLYNLGWHAVPVLIEHLDDPRPTRSMGFGRSWWPSSYHLLRYGDACQQVLEAIAGLDVYESRTSSGYMMKNGKASEAKEKAEKWWATVKDMAEEKRYLWLVRNGKDSEQYRNTHKLLDLNKEKYLPVLARIVEKDTPDRKKGLFDALAWYVDRKHSKILVQGLSAENIKIVFLSAKMLWNKFNSKNTIKALFERMKSTDEDLKITDHYVADDIMEFIHKNKNDFITGEMCEAVKTGSEDMRTEMLENAHLFIDRKMLEALVGLFDDKGPSTAGANNRICDLAAKAACRIIKNDKDYPYIGETEVKDKFIRKLKEHIEKNIGSFDWETLRKNAEKKEK